jgi:general secretion pathway protein K
MTLARRPQTQAPQRGAALLSAMVVVALVATLASAALWQQWRQVEIETAERGRSQTQWMMTGALDWTRLILREDAVSGGGQADHLGEPWALPVQESKLSTFLSQDQQWHEGDAEVFLSGQITDAQSRMNVMNLVEEGRVSPEALARFAKLFQRLDLPLAQLPPLAAGLQQALARSTPNPPTTGRAAGSADAPLMPQQTSQLVWLGLSPETLAVLAPYIILLPTPTPVNLNTASAPVLEAMVPGLDAAGARQWVNLRERGHWATLEAARLALGPAGQRIDAKLHSVSSQFFEVRGRMRIDQVVQEELALVQRDSGQVRMLWRVRSAARETAPITALRPLQ